MHYRRAATAALLPPRTRSSRDASSTCWAYAICEPSTKDHEVANGIRSSITTLRIPARVGRRTRIPG